MFSGSEVKKVKEYAEENRAMIVALQGSVHGNGSYGKYGVIGSIREIDSCLEELNDKLDVILDHLGIEINKIEVEEAYEVKTKKGGKK